MSRFASLGNQLYTGERSLDVVGRQRRWYAISGVILVASLILRQVVAVQRSVGVRLARAVGVTAHGLERQRLNLLAVGRGQDGVFVPAVIVQQEVAFPAGGRPFRRHGK